MPADIQITVRCVGLRLRDVEPDGQKCTFCEDACYLSATAIDMQLQFDGEKWNPFYADSDIIACHSCRDCAEDLVKEHHGR